VGVPVSLILVAVGLVLALAVHHDPNAAVNVHVVGWILFLVGLVGLLLSLVWWDRWGPGYWGWSRSYGGPPGRAYPGRGWGYRGRRTVVEEEGPPPPPPADPYDGPPPP
jgi:hypothetical protein